MNRGKLGGQHRDTVVAGTIVHNDDLDGPASGLSQDGMNAPSEQTAGVEVDDDDADIDIHSGYAKLDPPDMSSTSAWTKRPIRIVQMDGRCLRLR